MAEISWYREHLPRQRKEPLFEGPAAKAAEDIFNKALPNDPVRTVMERLPGDIHPTLVDDFNTHWEGQIQRIKREGFEKMVDKKKHHANARGAFRYEVDFFRTVVQNVEQVIEHQGDAPTVVFFDVDETIGKVGDTGEALQIPDSVLALPKDERDAAVNNLRAKDSIDRLAIRPSFKHAVQYLREKHGSKVRFGILTTKEQERLDKFLVEKINTLCDGAFDKELVMSSRDGAAYELTPDVHEWLHEAVVSGETLTFESALERFLVKYPEMSELVPERLVNKRSINYKKGISDYDIKLFMLLRLLAKSRREGREAMQHGEPEDEHPDEWHEQVHPGAAFVLFDDVVQSMVLGEDQSLKIVHVKEFLLPDDTRFRTK